MAISAEIKVVEMQRPGTGVWFPIQAAAYYSDEGAAQHAVTLKTATPEIEFRVATYVRKNDPMDALTSEHIRCGRCRLLIDLEAVRCARCREGRS